MKLNKSCANDLVTAEMLMFLDEEAYDMLAEMFKLRLLNHFTENDEIAWRENVIQCILKKVDPTHANKLRPITVLPVIQKVYMAVVLALE